MDLLLFLTACKMHFGVGKLQNFNVWKYTLEIGHISYHL